MLCDRAVAETDPFFARGDVYRVQDAWLKSDAARALAIHPRILDLLRVAYGREPFPFQTLNFQKGTQQEVHSDAIHFHSEPERFMCGVWIALEDVAEAAGPLDYLPGSHKLPVLTMQAAGVNREPPEPADYVSHYLPALRAHVDAAGLPKLRARLTRGQALVWAANTAHGGAPIADPQATRRSLVVHFFFEDCVYYTPMVSNPLAGRYKTRLPINVATGRWVWPRRDGRRAPVSRGAVLEAVLRRLMRRPSIEYTAGSSRIRKAKTSTPRPAP